MTTYATLKTDIPALIVRPDLTEAQVIAFIRLAEARIARRLRLRGMEQTATLAVSSLATALPADFLEARSLTLDSSNGRKLKPLSSDSLRSSSLIDVAGDPSFYAIEGSNLLVAPIPTSASVLITYYGKFDALSADSDTNWVLTNAYDIYLYGSLRAAAEWYEDQALEDRFEGKFNTAVEELQRMDQRAYWGKGNVQSGILTGTVV